MWRHVLSLCFQKKKKQQQKKIVDDVQSLAALTAELLDETQREPEIQRLLRTARDMESRPTALPPALLDTISTLPCFSTDAVTMTFVLQKVRLFFVDIRVIKKSYTRKVKFPVKLMFFILLSFSFLRIHILYIFIIYLSHPYIFLAGTFSGRWGTSEFSV